MYPFRIEPLHKIDLIDVAGPDEIASPVNGSEVEVAWK